MGAPWLVVAVLLCTSVAARPGGTDVQEGSGAAVVAPSVLDVLHNHKRSATRIFERLDSNQDGAVSKMEMARHSELNGAAAVGSGMQASTITVQADENADGMVDAKEYTAWFTDRKLSILKNQEDFSAADANDDGKLSYEEYKKSPMADAKVASLHSLHGCPADYNPGPSDTFCKGKPSTALEIARSEFTRMDRNKDMHVSKGEFMLDRSADDHGAADRDGDGSVDEEEYQKAPKHWRGYGVHRTREEKHADFMRADRNKDGKISRKEYEMDHKRKRISAVTANELDTTVQDKWVIYHEPLIAQGEPHFESLPAPRKQHIGDMDDVDVDDIPGLVDSKPKTARAELVSSTPISGEMPVGGARGSVPMTEQEVFAL